MPVGAGGTWKNLPCEKQHALSRGRRTKHFRNERDILVKRLRKWDWPRAF
jgi:hypothetical protein